MGNVINDLTNIYEYPREFKTHSGSITLGDLHGNPLKLLHILFRHGIIEFNESVSDPSKYYQELVSTYERSGKITDCLGDTKAWLRMFGEALQALQAMEVRDLSQEQVFQKTIQEAIQDKQQLETLHEENLQALIDSLNFFNKFIDQLKIKDRSVLIRLIGDEVADRGANDYFTLQLLAFLDKNSVNQTKLISNHGCEFISAYECLFNRGKFTPLNMLEYKYKRSLNGLICLFEETTISRELLEGLIDIYKQNLKIIDYSLSENKISLFSHAPIRFDVIEMLASHLEVAYQDGSKEALAATIDKINLKFQVYVKENRVNELCKGFKYFDITNMTMEKIKDWPLLYIIWNRWSTIKDTQEARPKSKNGYELDYVHGHDYSYQSQYLHVFNLDTLCGKGTYADFLAISPENLNSLKQPKVFDSNYLALEKKSTIEEIKMEYQTFSQRKFTNLAIGFTFFPFSNSPMFLPNSQEIQVIPSNEASNSDGIEPYLADDEDDEDTLGF